MNKIQKDVSTPNLSKRLKKARNIPSERIRTLDQKTFITSYIQTSKHYKVHISVTNEVKGKARWKRYSCGCFRCRTNYDAQTSCMGNTNSSIKTVCYHVLRTILEIYRDEFLIVSDDTEALKEYTLRLTNKPKYIEIVNRQLPDNESIWGIIIDKNEVK